MLIIRNGRVIDPASGRDGVFDLYIKDGRICDKTDCESSIELDASGLVVAPGLVDVHVHFRDPGYTYKEDIFSGAEAAAAGGVTTAVCMPNTNPVLDSAELISDLLQRSRQAAVNVLSFSAVTRGQKGAELTDFAKLSSAGAAALSDDGMPIDSEDVMRAALVKAKELGLLISAHCEYSDMVKNYAVNEGRVSGLLGLPGRPAAAEELMISRDVRLAGETGGKVHIAHVSTAKSVDIIRKAKASGVAVTAETCPQYFTLTEDAILERGEMARVNPPLRTEEDRLAIIEGLRDGTLDCLVTDHAPHSVEEKSRGLADSMSGMVGLETSLALAVTVLHREAGFKLSDIIKIMSTNPSQILGIGKGRLLCGDAADLVIFDPNERWTVDPEQFKSRGRNTPFAGMELYGRVKYTIVNGKTVYRGI